MAAYRAGMKTVIVPAENESDLQDIEPVVRENIHFVLAETMKTVLDTALCKSVESELPALPFHQITPPLGGTAIIEKTTMKQ